MDERAFFTESHATKPAQLNCPFCRSIETYDLKWLVRKKKDRLPNGAGHGDQAKFAKIESYMVLLDDKADCKKCRRKFDISGIRTTALLVQ